MSTCCKSQRPGECTLSYKPVLGVAKLTRKMKSMDLRIEKTYRALIAAFTELLEQRRYEDISVSLLCECSLIRRTTFYKHFADKDEFFRFFLLSMRNEFRENTSVAARATSVCEYQSIMLQALVAFLKEHASIVDNVVNSSMSGALFDTLADVMEHDLITVLAESKQNDDSTSNANAQLQAAYLASGPIAVLKRWWKNGHDNAQIDALVAVVKQGSQGF